jgi:hypothetical protein
VVVTRYLDDASLCATLATSRTLRASALREHVYSSRVRALARAPSSWSWGTTPAARLAAASAVRALVPTWRAAYVFLQRFGLGNFRVLAPSCDRGYLGVISVEDGALLLRVAAPGGGCYARNVDIVLGAAGPEGGSPLPVALRLRAPPAGGGGGLPPQEELLESHRGRLFFAAAQLRELLRGEQTPEQAREPLMARVRGGDVLLDGFKDPFGTATAFALERLPVLRPPELASPPHALLASATGIFSAAYGTHGQEAILFTLHQLGGVSEAPPAGAWAAAGGASGDPDASTAAGCFGALSLFLRDEKAAGMEHFAHSTFALGGDPACSTFSASRAAEFISVSLPPGGCAVPVGITGPTGHIGLAGQLQAYVLLGRKVTGDPNVPSGQVSIIAVAVEAVDGEEGVEPHLNLRAYIQCNRTSIRFDPYLEPAAGRLFSDRIIISGRLGFEMVFKRLDVAALEEG